MDRDEELKLLKEGRVEEWNRRRSSREIPSLEKADLRYANLHGATLRWATFSKADLSGATLSEADLSGANLSGANLSEANLSEANLHRATLRWATLSKTDLRWANLGLADLRWANLSEAILSGADLSGAILSEADLSGATLSGADLRGATLSGATLRWATLSEAKLSRADLREADLRAADLRGADLRGATLSLADLSETILSEADLRGAILSKAKLRGATLSKAKLRGADLRAADLRAAILSEAKLSGADLSEAQMGGTVLCSLVSEVQGIGSIQHDGPSFISTDTLVLSKGRIPVSFLRGCGLAPWEVLNARLYDPNLTPSEIEELLYKVFDKRAHGPIFIGGLFISHSWKNSDFVDMLYERLKKEGANVWLDRHHAVAGPLQKQIDRAIRLNDVVLIVLSKAAIESDWVENELEMARKKEKEEKRDVLCPIALDDSWISKLEPDEPYRGLWRTLTQKNVLDFSKWDSGEFESTYEKLIRGLKIYYPPADKSATSDPSPLH